MSKNPIVFFEIGSTDNNQASAFFKGLFDWDIQAMGPSQMIDAGEGIGGHITELAPEWGNYVTVYVQVDDLEAYLEKAVELGGKVLVKPVHLPGQGSFAWFAPPEGNIMGLWKPE